MMEVILKVLRVRKKGLVVEKEDSDIDPSVLLLAMKSRRQELQTNTSAYEAKERLKRVLNLQR